jgi:MFS superfamily sulfate permease-like transporter
MTVQMVTKSVIRLAANAGARTPMASFFTALFTLLATFFLLQYLYYLPKAVLGCIISLVVYSILAEGPEDVAFFVGMKAWSDLALMSLTFLLTLLVSVQVSSTIVGR